MSSKTASRLGLTFSLKLSLLYALFFVISSISLFLVAYYLISTLVEQREREVIQERINEYQAWYNKGGLRALKARFEDQSDISREIYFVRIIGPLGNALFVSFPKGIEAIDPPPPIAQLPAPRSFWQSFRGVDEQNIWTIGTAPLRGGLILQVGKSSIQARELLSYFRSVFLRFVIPILLLGIVGGAILTFRAMIPIRRLIQTVRDILQTGKMDTRVPERSDRGELDELVSLFNQMLVKNDALIQGMHTSLDSVAHDLRTPMTRLRGIAELAFQNADDINACYEALADCMEESERVLTMLNTLMDVAEAETGAMRLDQQAVSISKLIESVVNLYDIVADEKNIEVATRLPGEMMIKADGTRLRQVVANLLDNALKYSGDGRKVTIEAFRQGEYAVIEVADQGVGIVPEDIPRIWRRLYRADRSRSERGLGLGLSFVKAIVEAHGGSVRVESEPNRGSRFTVKLPGLLDGKLLEVPKQTGR